MSVRKFLAVLTLVGLLSGCGGNSGSGSGSSAAGSGSGKQFRIGVVLKTLQSEYFVNMKNGAEQAGKDLGVTVTVQAPERADDVEGQTRILENMVRQKSVDALVITPINSDALGGIVADAKAAGIPVFAADTKLNAPDVVSFIGVDNQTLARQIAQYMVRFAKESLGGSAEIVILEGTPGAGSTTLRNTGYKEAINNEPAIKILASQPGNYQRAKGNQVAEDLLTRFPQTKIILAANDEMALGAIQAVEARGLKLGSDIYVVGFNAQTEAVKAVQDGKMLATVYANEVGMAYTAVKVTVDYLKTGTKPSASLIGQNGLVVDKLNVGTFNRNQEFK